MTDGPADARRALDALPDLVWVTGPDGAVEYLNRRCAEDTGLPVDDLLGWDWGWVLHPDDLPGLDAALADLLARPGGQVVVSARFRHEDGSYRRVRARGTNLLPDPDVRAVAVTFWGEADPGPPGPG